MVAWKPTVSGGIFGGILTTPESGGGIVSTFGGIQPMYPEGKEHA